MGRKKLPCVGSLDGKTAAVVAAKCLRDDSNSSDEEIHALEHVSGSNHDCDSATKAKHRSQVWVLLIMDLDDEESLGKAT